jgi:hypothetical protein
MACPFEKGSGSAHPANAKYPENFSSFEFNFDKVASKLSEEAMIYIFYNVMDEHLQLAAARTLYHTHYLG